MERSNGPDPGLRGGEGTASRQQYIRSSPGREGKQGSPGKGGVGPEGNNAAN